MRRPLLALFLFALGLRLVGIGFGLDTDDVRRVVFNNLVDERGMVQAEVEGFLRGNLHPGSFIYRGSAGFYLFGLADAAVLAVHALLGDGWDASLAAMDANPSLVFYVHRCVSALAGALTALVLLLTLRRELGARAGWIAGLLAATSYLHVRESHQGTIDVLWGLVTVWTLDVALRLARDPRRARYVRLGLLAGLGAATKYFGALLGAHMLAAHVRARAAHRPAPPHRWLLLAYALTPLGFLLGSTYLLYAWDDFAEMFRFSVEIMGSEATTTPWTERLAHHLRHTLFEGLGEPVTLAALAGIVLGLRRGGAARLLALFPLLMLPSVLLTNITPVRYGLALHVLCLAPAAVALDALLARLPRLPGLVAVGLALAPSLARDVSYDLLLTRADTRQLMLEELERRELAAADVLGVGYRGMPRPHWGRPRPYTDLLSAMLSGVSPTLEEVRAQPPAYLLLERPTRPYDEGIEAFFAPLLASSYEEVLRLDGRRDPDAVELPDPVAGTPPFHVPYANPWAMRRPGPALVLYRRRDTR